MRKQEGGKKGSFSRQKSQDVLRLEDLRVGELREENDIGIAAIWAAQSGKQWLGTDQEREV